MSMPRGCNLFLGCWLLSRSFLGVGAPGVVGGDEFGVALSEIVVVDAMASRHELEGERQRRERHFLVGSFKPDEAGMRRLLVVVDNRFTSAFEFGQRF